MGDRYIVVADYGSWQVVEPVGSENTDRETERILEQCRWLENRSRRKKREREEAISGILTAVMSAVFPVVFICFWALSIRY